ncbi:MAG: 3-deoxy-D-manno-octulosonic acid transferase [Candidatus Zixiibacteriota bacterium]
MKILYRLISALIYFTLWPYGRVRALFGCKTWRGRLGLIEKAGPVDIWLHASSVGETKIARYLIDYLHKKNPELRIYLTTMTHAGQVIAEALTKAQVKTGYLPIDSIGPVNRTIRKVNPHLVVITETEIWPNLITQCHIENIPIILVNGRMSEKAFSKYKLIPKMMSELLAFYEEFFVKTEEDKNRFSYFGVITNKLAVAGDMKFDAPLLDRSEQKIQEIRKLLGAGERDFVLVAGSTRPGEETLLFNLFSNLSGAGAPIRLVIAPRHLNRIEQLKAEMSLQNLEFGIYGSGNGVSPITLVDKMGELDRLYQAANLAFVGGTLVNVGGHNILEPVWAGTPVVFGPYVNNVIEAKDYVLHHNYGAMVNDIAELTDLTARVKAGEKTFSIKEEKDLKNSPTAIVGEYILGRIANV